MLKKIETAQLKIGMFISIQESWFKHSLLKSNFTIKTDAQIQKIADSGIKEITIDIAKGLAVDETEAVSHHNPVIESSKSWNPEDLLTDELKDIIDNETLPVEEKAQKIYSHSVDLMNKLLENPTSEIIKEGKKGIASIVDLILSDKNVPDHLLMIMSHDFYTYTHSINVGVLSVTLCKRLYGKKVSNHDMHELGAGFFLHDLGKTRVDPAIINKPGKLTKQEMKRMKTHPFQSYKILHETNQLSEEAGIVAMQHHERDDGEGYPLGLKGEEIHEYGRISCIADVFDALTAERSYKRSMNHFEALTIMKNEMLGHFHKDIFKNFVLLFS